MLQEHIYGLACPLTGQIRYVGISTSVQERYASHCRAALKAVHKTPKEQWIADLREQGLKPDLVILESHNTDTPPEHPTNEARENYLRRCREAAQAERSWAQKLVHEGHALTNTYLVP